MCKLRPIKIKRSRLTLKHLFKISTTLWILLLKSKNLVYATKLLVSYANSIGIDLLFIILDHLCMRISKGPKTV